MKEKKDCKIVQDLLPNYIEGLTNAETNNFIEEHFNECDECKKVLENMQKNVEVNTTIKDKKAVRYFKKYRNKLRVLRIILLIIIVIFVGNTARKMIIISNLSKKSEAYTNSENYHSIYYIYSKDRISISEVWNLGDKRKSVATDISLDGTTVSSWYGNKIGTDEWGNELYNANIYSSTATDKTAKLDVNSNIFGGISQTLLNVFSEDFHSLLLMSLHSSLKNTTFNGEECYYLQSSVWLFNMYISKNTGLTVGTLTQDVEISEGVTVRMPLQQEAVYEFNTVTKDDFIEPDISEYEIIQ